MIRDLVRELGFASIGYSVLGARWGRGYATRIARQLVARARRELGAREIRAGVRPDNAASEVDDYALALPPPEV